jgi:hypothetical protein
MKKIIENENFIEFRETPWDKRAFDIKTIEIVNFNNISENNLLKTMENNIKTEALIYYRSNSNNQHTKKIMINNNYYIAETAIHLFNYKIKSTNFSDKFRNKLKLDTVIQANDIQQLKDIAESAFEFSRFHEDPFVDINKSKLRYINWIDDLIKQEKKILIYRNSSNEVISFMFYEYLKEDKVDLILGGSKNSYGYITPSFWASVMTFLQEQNVKKIDVLVSASNIQIFNLYIKLGFTIRETLFDYHRKLQNESVNLTVRV